MNIRTSFRRKTFLKKLDVIAASLIEISFCEKLEKFEFCRDQNFNYKTRLFSWHFFVYRCIFRTLLIALLLKLFKKGYSTYAIFQSLLLQRCKWWMVEILWIVISWQYVIDLFKIYEIFVWMINIATKLKTPLLVITRHGYFGSH